MALEIETSQEIDVRVTQKAIMTKAQVNSVFVDFEKQSLIVEVLFGLGDPFEVKKRELWLISGELFGQLLAREIQGKDFATASAEGFLYLLSYIQDVPKVKETAIASGELQVIEGNLFNHIMSKL
jgi:hypothetical protein